MTDLSNASADIEPANASADSEADEAPSQSNVAKQAVLDLGLPPNCRLEDFRTSAHNITFGTANWGHKEVTNECNRQCSYIVRDLLSRVAESTQGAELSIASAQSDAAKDDLRSPTKITMRFKVVRSADPTAASELEWLEGLKRGVVPRDSWMHTADFGLNALGDISAADEQEVVEALGTELASILGETDEPKEWTDRGKGECGDLQWDSQVGPDHTGKLGTKGFEWQVSLGQSSNA